MDVPVLRISTERVDKTNYKVPLSPCLATVLLGGENIYLMEEAGI
jgi:hypothetical protein